MGDGAAFNFIAMQQAIEDSGLEEKEVSNERTGLIVGSGGPSTKNLFAAHKIVIEKGSPKRMGPFMVTRGMSSTNSAEFVDDIPRVTINGPILLGLPFSITILCAANKFFVEGPPDPTISPVLSLETSFSSSPLSSIACCIAIKLKAAPSPINLS